jgi:DNA-binding response OmpR family regulator
MIKEKKKVLLVEDDQNFGSILRDFLEINNFDVTLARNGVEGGEKFQRNTQDRCWRTYYLFNSQVHEG